MRFKFTNFINQNGLDELVDHNVCKYKGKNDNFIRLGQDEEDKEQQNLIEAELILVIYLGCTPGCWPIWSTSFKYFARNGFI